MDACVSPVPTHRCRARACLLVVCVPRGQRGAWHLGKVSKSLLRERVSEGCGVVLRNRNSARYPPGPSMLSHVAGSRSFLRPSHVPLRSALQLLCQASRGRRFGCFHVLAAVKKQKQTGRCREQTWLSDGRATGALGERGREQEVQMGSHRTVPGVQRAA